MLEWLVSRLENKYSSIKINFRYEIGQLKGEVDILTFEEEGNTRHFYEVKGYFTRKGYERAEEQYEIYCRANPHQKVKGIYVSQNKIRGLRLKGNKKD